MNSADETRRAKLWFATTQIDEYFRRLGGSGCYPGYCDWHVPALLTLALDQNISGRVHHQEQSVKELISPHMLEKTDGLPQTAVDLVAKLEPTSEDIEWFITRVTDHYPMTYCSHEIVGWAEFLDQRQRRKKELS